MTGAVVNQSRDPLGEALDWRKHAARYANREQELRVLAQDRRSYIVRRLVAGNRACPPDVLLALVQDDHSDARLAAARNNVTPARARSLLASDHHDEIRVATTCHARPRVNVQLHPDVLAPLDK